MGDVGQHVGGRHSRVEAIADLGGGSREVGRERVAVHGYVFHNFACSGVKVRAGNVDGDGGRIKGAGGRAIVFYYYLAHAGGGVAAAVALKEKIVRVSSDGGAAALGRGPDL